MSEPEVSTDDLNEEVARLKKCLMLLKQEKKSLIYKVMEAKNEVESRDQKRDKDAAEAKRLAALTPPEKKMESLNELVKLYRIFGVEVLSKVQNGASVAFHNWYKGVKVDTNTVVLKTSGQGKIVMMSHSLPPSSMRWLKPVPCVSPYISIYETLKDIRKSCFHWNNRYHQLEELKARYPEIKTSSQLSLLSINLKAQVTDIKSQKKDIYEITLLYEPHSIYSENIEVKMLKGLEENYVLDSTKINAMKSEVDSFYAMPIADAFYFIFQSTDDSTRRTITSV